MPILVSIERTHVFAFSTFLAAVSCVLASLFGDAPAPSLRAAMSFFFVLSHGIPSFVIAVPPLSEAWNFLIASFVFALKIPSTWTALSPFIRLSAFCTRTIWAALFSTVHHLLNHEKSSALNFATKTSFWRFSSSHLILSLLKLSHSLTCFLTHGISSHVGFSDI